MSIFKPYKKYCLLGAILILLVVCGCKKKTYSITFKDSDHTILKTIEVEKNEIPIYVGTPEKESDELYDYTFFSWDKDLTEATEDTEYIAVYKSTLKNPIGEKNDHSKDSLIDSSEDDDDDSLDKKAYYITFLDDNGVILQKSLFTSGETPYYKTGTPSSKIVGDYIYVFSNWDKVITPVTGATEYKAVYAMQSISDTLPTSITNPENPIKQCKVSLSSNNPSYGYCNGGGTFDSGTEITLKAIPNPGYVFLYWKEDGSNNPERTFVVKRDTSFTAVFGEDNPEELEQMVYIGVTVYPDDSGYVEGVGSYPKGTLVTLTAKPKTYKYTFESWNSHYKITNIFSDTISFVADESYFFTPNFTKTPNLINIRAESYDTNIGTVTIENKEDDDLYALNAVLRLSATPKDDYQFDCWRNSSNEIVSTSPKFDYQVLQDDVLTAFFEEKTKYPINITVSPDYAGSVTVKGGDVYQLFLYGTELTLEATPASEEYVFSGWEDLSAKDSNRTQSTRIIEVSKTNNFVARFTPANNFFKELEYIDCNGSSYFDTGFKPNQDTRIVIYGSDMVIDNNFFLGSARKSSGGTTSDSFEVGLITNSSKKFRATYGTEAKVFDSLDTNKLKKDFVADMNKNKYYFNTELLHEFGASTFQCDYSFYLFTLDENGAPFSTKSKYHLKKCEIYDNGELVRNFIPVQRTMDNAVGLYDTVNEKFYRPAVTSSSINSGEIVEDGEQIVANRYRINVISNDSSKGTVTYSSAYAYEGDIVNITSAASGSNVFLRWSDGNTDETRSIEVHGDINLIGYFGSSFEKDYTIVDGIKSDGSQYIDTGYYPSFNLKVIVSGRDITLPTDANDDVLFGASTADDSYRLTVNNTDKPLVFKYKDTNSLNYSDFTKSDVANSQFTITMDINSSTASFNSKSKSYNYPDGANGPTPNKTLYLFANNNNGTAESHSSYVLTSCQIYNYSSVSSTYSLLVDYVPVKRNSDGKLGLYDKANDLFNEGNGTFTEYTIVNPAQATISVSANDDSLGSVTGGGIVDINVPHTIEATPKSNCVFIKWSDGDTTNPRSFTPTEPTTYYYTAIFGEQFEDQYTIIDYLETDGNQYINLGKPFVDGYSIDAIFKPAKAEGSTRYLFGTAYSLSSADANALFGTVEYVSSPVEKLSFKTRIANIDLSEISCSDNWYTYNLEYVSAKKYTASISSTEETGTYTNALSNKNIYLFNNADINPSTGFVGKLRKFSLLDSTNNYIMDLVPVMKNNTGQKGLYDRITKTFYVAHSANDFVDKTKTDDSYLANYTKLNSISSTELGNQIIKTGVNPSSKTRIVLNVKPKSSGAIFYSKKNSKAYSLILNGATSYLTLGSAKYKFNESALLNNDLTINVYQGITVNAVGIDLPVIESDDKSGLNTTYPTIEDEIVLFGKSDASSCCVMDISGVSIYEDSVLVRNFIPVINSSGRVGLLDTVNKEFYDNANPEGSGFVANKDADVLTYTNLDWITLNSSNYIDTGIKGGVGIGISACFEPINKTNGQYLGVISDDKSFVVGADFEADKGYYVYNSDGNKVYLSDSSVAELSRKVTIDYCYSDLSHSLESSSSAGSKETSFSDALDNIYIGKVNGSNDSQEAKYYRVKIKQNGVLVRDLVPVLNNETNKIGLYDKVNKKFYAVCEASSKNKSTKALKKGDIIILDGQTKGVNDKYIVVDIRDDLALLMSHNGGIKADFTGLNTTDYESIDLGQQCKNFYNSISGTNKDAIVVSDIKLLKNTEDTALKKDSHVSTAKLASAAEYATYSNVYVYPISISDVEKYFGGSGTTASASLTSQGLKELFPVSKENQNIRLFSLSNADNKSYLVYYQYDRGIASNYHINSGNSTNGTTGTEADSVIYPAFLYDYNSEKASYHLYADEYNSIEYIENRSNQYIDLGIGCDQIKSIDLRFNLIKDNQDQILFGAYSKTNGGSNYAQWVGDKFNIYGNSTATQLATNISLNTIYRVTTPVTSKGTAYLYNENTGASVSKAITKENKELLNMFLFTLNNDGQPSPVHNTMMRVYSLKLYGLDGTIIMNLKPVERASDHTIGFLDEVTGKFLVDSNINGKFYKGDYQSYSNSAINIYEKLECITSNGNQYIDTGKILPRVSKIETKFITTSISKTSASMFGSYQNNKPWTHLMCFANMYCAGTSISSVFVNNTIYTVTSDVDSSNKWHVTINGDSQDKDIGTEAIDDGGTYKLFASGHSGDYKGKGSIYYFKIWEEGSLTFDLIPVRRQSDNVLGMLNLVDNKFYTNKGTGSFTGTSKAIPEYISVADDYASIEYLESTGKEYIDTGVKNVTQSTRLVVTANALDDGKSIFGIHSTTGKLKFNYTGVNDGDIYRFSDYEKKFANKLYRRQIYTYDLYKGLKITDSTGTVIVDDNYGKLTNSLSIPDLNIYLFFRNTSSGPADGGRTRIYSCKIYNGSDLIRDFVPVRRISDNELGLYDKVEQKFYSNAASDGKFITSSMSANILTDFSDVEKYTISGVPADYSMGSVTGSGSYSKDDPVTLTAIAKDGYRFSHWSDGSTSASKKFNAESSFSYIAYFERLPVKGDIITLNDDNRYRVVSVNNNKYLVVRMSSIGSRSFNNASSFISFGGDLKGGSYVSSNISRYLSENWYSNLIKGIKNSVLQTVLKQSYYAISTGNNLWYKDGVTSEDTVNSVNSKTYSFVKKSFTTVTITQNAFLLDVDDICSYFGDTSIKPQELIEFFTGDTNSIDEDRESKCNILLRSASNMGFTSLSLRNGKFNEVTYDFVGQVYPAFTLDINNPLLTYTIENRDIYSKKIIVARSKDEHLGTVTGGGRYNDGTVVSLKAIPNPGCKFVKWEDNDSTIAEREIKVTSDEEYVAVFSQLLPNKGDIIELADYTNNKYMGYGEYTVLSISGNNAVLLSRDHCVEPTAFSSTSPIADYQSSSLNLVTNINSSSSLKNRYSSSILNAIISTDIISRSYVSLPDSSDVAINIVPSSISQFGSNSIIAESYALDINDILQFFGATASSASKIDATDIAELFNLSAFPNSYLNNGFWLRSIDQNEAGVNHAFYINKNGYISTDVITNKKASCYAFTINLKAPNIAYKLKGALSCTPNWVSSSCTVITNSLGKGHVTGAEEQVYNSGRTLFLSAVPEPGYVFLKWTDGVSTPNRAITTSNKTIQYTAVFTKSTTLSKGLKISLYNEPRGKQNYTILNVNGQILTLMLSPEQAYIKDFVTPYNIDDSSFVYPNSTIDNFCSSFFDSLSSSLRLNIPSSSFKPNFYQTISTSNGNYVSSSVFDVLSSSELTKRSYVPDITTLENYLMTSSKTSYSNEELINLLGITEDSNYCIWLASQNAKDSTYTPYIIDNKGNIVNIDRKLTSYNGYPIIACPIITVDIGKYQNYFIY